MTAEQLSDCDAMGRATSLTQTLGAQNFTVGYTYDRAGELTQTTYPSGRTVNYSYDTAARTTSVAGNLGGASRTYTSEITYSALGGLTKEKFGTDTPVYNKLLLKLSWATV